MFFIIPTSWFPINIPYNAKKLCDSDYMFNHNLFIETVISMCQPLTSRIKQNCDTLPSIIEVQCHIIFSTLNMLMVGDDVVASDTMWHLGQRELLQTSQGDRDDSRGRERIVSLKCSGAKCSNNLIWMLG